MAEIGYGPEGWNVPKPSTTQNSLSTDDPMDKSQLNKSFGKQADMFYGDLKQDDEDDEEEEPDDDEDEQRKQNASSSQISEEGAGNPDDSNFPSSNLDDVDLYQALDGKEYQDNIKPKPKSNNATLSGVPKSANSFSRGGYKRDYNSLQKGLKGTDSEKYSKLLQTPDKATRNVDHATNTFHCKTDQRQHSKAQQLTQSKSKSLHQNRAPRASVQEETAPCRSESVESKDEPDEKDESSDDESMKNLILRPPQITPDMTKREKYLKKPPNNNVVLTYGPIPGRAPSVFFNYPAFLKMQRPYKPENIQIVTQKDLQPYSYLYFRISSQQFTYNCVVNALKAAGFWLVNRGQGQTSWNFFWAPLIRPNKLKNMNSWQKMNHFAGAWGLGSKANMWRNVQKQRRLHGKAFDICPMTYIFPEDYKRFMNDREMSNYQSMYIFKPTGACCGRGIKVIGKKDTVPKKGGYLVSKYIESPHLLRGYKYDLRIYIVVTSFEPLKAYIFKEGLVRLATQPYTTNKNSLKQRFVHLTNYSVNKKAENYSKNKKTDTVTMFDSLGTPGTNADKADPKAAQTATTTDEEEQMESKWSLKMLKDEYEKMGIDYGEVYANIKDVCIKTLMSVEPYMVTQNRTAKSRNSCFEIYGFDVLMDTNMKPWLLEVNVLPSLSCSSPFDRQVKSILMSDTFHLLGFKLFDRRKILETQRAEKQ